MQRYRIMDVAEGNYTDGNGFQQPEKVDAPSVHPGVFESNQG